MRKFLKCLLAVLIVAIIGVVAYAASYYLYNKDISFTSNNGQQTNSSANETKVDEKKEDSKEEKEKSEEKEKKEQVEEVKKEEVVVKEEGSASEEDKAIDLAKKEYGSTDGVYFRIEQPKGNGVYEISVRDNETTRDLVWYTVDVKNGTVK